MAKLRFGTMLALIAVLLALPIAPARAQNTLPIAEQMIVRADALGANRDFDGAIRLLQSALERYPSYPRLYLALATWQEVRGLFAMSSSSGDSLEQRKTNLRNDLRKYPDISRELFDTFGLATMSVPDDTEIRRQIDGLTAMDYPTALGEYGPLALPGQPAAFTCALTDPQLPAEQRVVQQGLITNAALPVPIRADRLYAKDPKYGQEPKYAKDPRYGNWTFTRMLLAYAYDRNAKQWNLKFRVMWQDARGKEADRLELARQCARMLLRCYWLGQANAGLTPRFTQDGVVNVWLAEKGQAGGEAFNDNIYLMEVGVPRTALEWVRELAHEYGHQTFPAVGGYTKPEWGASGLLGERLFLRWLLQNPEPKANVPTWLQALSARDIKEMRIDRLVRHFANLGPTAPQMRDTDAAAMDAFVGMILYLEMTRGSKIATTALTQMTSPTFGDRHGFLATLEAQELYFQSGEQPSVTLRLGDLPSDAPLWVFLREGTWQGKVEGWTDLALGIRVEVDGRPFTLNADGAFTAPGLKQGWRRFRIIPPDNTPVSLAKLTLTRL